MVAVLPGAGGVLRGVVMAAVVAPAGRRGAAVAVAAAAVQGGHLAGLDGGAAGGQVQGGCVHKKASFGLGKAAALKAQRLGWGLAEQAEQGVEEAAQVEAGIPAAVAARMAGIDAGMAGVAAPAPAGTAGGDGGVVAVVVGAPAKVDGEAAEQVLDEGEDAAAAVDFGQFALVEHGAVGGQVETGIFHEMIPPYENNRLMHEGCYVYYNGTGPRAARGKHRKEVNFFRVERCRNAAASRCAPGPPL